MRRAVPVTVVILCVVVVAVMEAMMRLSPSRPTTGQSELNAITETIRSAFLTRGQACMAEHYDEQAQYETALNQYWSPATPNPSRIATLTVVWAAEAPTMEPALYAEIVATAQAEYSAGIIDEKTYLYSVDPSEPTPDCALPQTDLEFPPSRDMYPRPREETTMPRPRRSNFTAAEKVAIVREALLERTPVSEVCERHRIQPSQFYQWQKQLCEHGAAACGHDVDREASRLAKQVEALQARRSEKDGVIAEISQEYVRLKKANGAF